MHPLLERLFLIGEPCSYVVFFFTVVREKKVRQLWPLVTLQLLRFGLCVWANIDSALNVPDWHYKWFGFQTIDVCLNLALALVLFLSCITIWKGGRCVLPWAYLAVVALSVREAQLADDMQNAAANSYYFAVSLVVLILDFLLIFAVYSQTVGNPDKEKNHGNRRPLLNPTQQ